MERGVLGGFGRVCVKEKGRKDGESTAREGPPRRRRRREVRRVKRRAAVGGGQVSAFKTEGLAGEGE